MKIACWNVNSIRARQQRAARWLAKNRPDVLCLQELKVEDGTFPYELAEAAGYRAVVHGQKTYNGVAILSRHDPEDVRRTLEDDVDDPQARLVSARLLGIRVISVYVPNGGQVGGAQWPYKLAWLDRLERYLERHCDAGQPLVLCGDFNIAPTDRDVAYPEAWRGSVLCHQDVRTKLTRILAWGLVDLVAKQHPEGGVYSWWDYRGGALSKNDGLRIDLVLATRRLANACVEANVDRNERTGRQPSDHAPVVVRFDLTEC